MATQDTLIPSLTSIAEFVISPLFAWLWCSCIVLYSFRWVVTLQWEALRIRAQLKDGMKYLKQHNDPIELTRHFRNLHTQMMSLSKMRQPWREFCQSLIFPVTAPESKADAGASGDAAAGRGALIKATRSTEDFFHRSSLVSPYIDTRFFAAVPTQLTGLGILGTFCSLACGIYIAHAGLIGGNMQETQTALAQLLGGAGLAFTKSVVGILCSLVFARVENLTLKGVDGQLAQFNTMLHNRIEFASMEKLGTAQLHQSHGQQAQLERIATLLEMIHTDRSTANEKVVQQIVKEFRVTMASAASEEITYIASAFKQIHLALKETKEAIAFSGKNLAMTSDTATKAFKKNLHEISHQFHTNFAQTTEAMQATFKDSAKDVSQALTQGATSFGESLRKPAENLGSLINKLHQQLSQTNDLWMQSSTLGAEQAAKIMETHRKASECIAPLVTAAQAIATACQESQSALKDSSQAARQIAGAVAQIDTISKRLQGNWDDYCKRFEGVDRSLHQVVLQTNQSLQQYSERVKTFTLDLDKHMSKGLLSLAGAVGDLNQVVGSLPEAMQTPRKPAAQAAPEIKPFVAPRAPRF